MGGFKQDGDEVTEALQDLLAVLLNGGYGAARSQG